MAEVPAGIDDRMNGRCTLEVAVVVTPRQRAEVGRVSPIIEPGNGLEEQK